MHHATTAINGEAHHADQLTSEMDPADREAESDDSFSFYEDDSSDNEGGRVEGHRSNDWVFNEAWDMLENGQHHCLTMADGLNATIKNVKCLRRKLQKPVRLEDLSDLIEDVVDKLEAVRDELKIAKKRARAQARRENELVKFLGCNMRGCCGGCNA